MAVLLLVLMLVGCGKESKSTKAPNGKEKVTVALWGNDLLEHYTRYLCESFPEVEFKFVLATNSTDYYKFLHKHGSLPDILTVRRFSLRDAETMRGELYDLCNTEVASTFYGTYLDSYTYKDGTINWLPACAVVDGIIANKTLFKEHNIPLPHDYDSFVAACKAFEEKGIRGFAADYGQDYTCKEILQGCDIPQLMSMEGREWRQQYESGKTDKLSEKVWLPVFERFLQFKKDTFIRPEDAKATNWAPKEMFIKGKQAMYRGTGTDATMFAARNGDENIMLPYFGKQEKDNWFLTYPAFQVALNKKSMENPERKKLLLKILGAMLNQEGQRNINRGNNMVPYNKNVKLELLPNLQNLQPYIESNKMYIRLASNEMFRASNVVVQKIIRGEINDARTAYEEFNEELANDGDKAPVVISFKEHYSSDFDPQHGDKAASVIMNTVRKSQGTDLLFVQSCYASSDIFKGDYTKKELGYLSHIDGALPMKVTMTGDQVYELIEKTLAGRHGFGVVSNDSTLYVSSGFEMDLSRTKDGYKLNKLTRDGKDFDRKAKYTILLMGDRGWSSGMVVTEMGLTDYTYYLPRTDNILYKHLVTEGKALEKPTDYIKIH